MYKGKIEVQEIVIPQAFLSSMPKDKKIQGRIDYYKKHGDFPRLVVREDTKKLIDGYASYCAAKKLGIKTVRCSIITAKESFQYQGPMRESTSSKKDRIIAKKGNRCYICGRRLYSPTEKEYDGTNEFTLDHKVPLFKGGTNALDNIFPCCNTCNGLKGDFSYSYQLRKLIVRELVERGILPKERMPKK